MENLKKVGTLFHTTRTIENLEKIIASNFQVSYSREIFKESETDIPMISFSNVLLMETKSQINYGDYSIGLTKEWGIKKKLHPVAYTYDDSEYENSIQRLRHISEVGMELEGFSSLYGLANITLKSNPEYSFIFNQLLGALDRNGRNAVTEFFIKAHPTFVLYELFTKKITATNKKGDTFECFNDREWRFLPEDVIESFRYVPKKQDGGNDEQYEIDLQKFEEFLDKKKKYYKDITLGFDLDDLRFIIVKETNEVQRIFDALYRKYGNQEVLDKIQTGLLLVGSYEMIFNNL